MTHPTPTTEEVEALAKALENDGWRRLPEILRALNTERRQLRAQLAASQSICEALRAQIRTQLDAVPGIVQSARDDALAECRECHAQVELLPAARNLISEIDKKLHDAISLLNRTGVPGAIELITDAHGDIHDVAAMLSNNPEIRSLMTPEAK